MPSSASGRAPARRRAWTVVAHSSLETADWTQRYVVKILPGVYVIGTPLRTVPFVDIEGSGQGVTKIVTTYTNGPAYYLDNEALGWEFEGLGDKVPNPNVTVTWQSVAGVNYVLERSTNLASPFTLLATGIPGQPGTATYIDTNAPVVSPLLYRVGVGNLVARYPLLSGWYPEDRFGLIKSCSPDKASAGVVR